MRSLVFVCVLALIIANNSFADEVEFRPVDPENLLLMEFDTDGRHGTAAIELTPWIAPLNVAQVKTLTRTGFYDGLDLYRVIENFVAQGGDITEKKEKPAGTGLLKAELEISASDLIHPFYPVQSGDFSAPETGLVHGFAAARGIGDKVWLVHCPGVMAMARNPDIDTASTEFYFPIGQAPRHLDRNLTIIGRVIAGFEHIAGAKRDRLGGDGIIDDPADRTKIVRAVIASDLPDSERPTYEVQKMGTKAFNERLQSRRNRTGDFWHNKPPVQIDVCTVPVPVREVQKTGVE